MIPPLFGKQEVGILTGQKTLRTIWRTYMNLVTKYQISAINGCREKCDEKCAYMFNVYKKQLSRQTGSQGFQSGPLPSTFTHLRLCIVPPEITEPPPPKKISGGQNHKYDGVVEYFS